MNKYVIHLYNTDENLEIKGIISELNLEELNSQIKNSAEPAYFGSSDYVQFIGYFENCYCKNFHLETLEDFIKGLYNN